MSVVAVLGSVGATIYYVHFGYRCVYMLEFIRITSDKQVLFKSILKHCLTLNNILSLVCMVYSFGATKPTDWLTLIQYFMSKHYDGDIYAIKYFGKIVSFIRVRLYHEYSHVLLHGGYTKDLKTFKRPTRAYIMRALWREIKDRLSVLADKIIIEAPKDGPNTTAIDNFTRKRGFIKAVSTDEHTYYTLLV